ncbi:MAG: alpha/beta hydrolase [Afipia sp.]|nr:alpha/beta hydrolase [Afipia sp.]
MTDAYRHRSIWGHLMKLDFCQSYVDAGGIRTRYVDAGPKNAPPLIMIHGTGSSWECFCATLESHAQHFRCLAIDLAGSGFSDRPDEPYEIGFYVKHVVAFMDALGIDKASFIGVSLGAWVTSRLVVDHPGRVEKITLLAPSSTMRPCLAPNRFVTRQSMIQAGRTSSRCSIRSSTRRKIAFPISYSFDRRSISSRT